MELSDSERSWFNSEPQEETNWTSSGAKEKRLLDWPTFRIWKLEKESRPLERARISAMSSLEDILIRCTSESFTRCGAMGDVEMSDR